MKVPVWEESPGALVALINSGEFEQAELYTLTLAGAGDPIRFTNADFDISFPGGSGGLWSARGVAVDPEGERPKGRWTRGLSHDSWQVTVLPRLYDLSGNLTFPDKIGDQPWTAAARQGALDGADFQVDRAYFAKGWNQPFMPEREPVGVLTIFAGLTAEVDVTDLKVILQAQDYRVLLSTQMPRNVYQPGCRHTLFDAGCQLNPASFVRSASALSGSTRSRLVTPPSLVPPGSGTYSLGRVLITSGANEGFSRTISTWSGLGGAFNYLYLLNPLPYDLADGDTFDCWPGCDKSQAACVAFANLANFGGEPYIPAPETAV